MRVRPSSWMILAATAFFGLYLSLSMTGAAMDRALSPARFGILHRAASGTVVIVEMDAQSTAVIKRWPWSRSYYAAAVDRLREAGASPIVFDVEFSSSSDSGGDRAFAAALARAEGRVVLPTFGQTANSTDQRTIDALPIPEFRSHAALASVNIAPDPDGQVRTMPFGTMTAGVPRPSLSAYIAQRSGAADTGFPIDMSIDPATIPRLSFIDVVRGRFDPATVRGHSVLIGATAIEMGDRYGTPQWGVIPGVVVQAMAAETLLRGVPGEGAALVPYLIALLAAAAMVAAASTRRLLFASALSLSVTVAVVLAVQHWLLVTYPLAVALGMIFLAGIACALRDVSDSFRLQRTIDEATGLPNARAMSAVVDTTDAITLIAIQIDNYDSLLAVLGVRGTSDVVTRVSERLALIADERRVFRTSERQLAFTLPADQPIEDTLDGLRLVLRQPVEVAGRRVDVAASAGVSSGTDTVEHLLVEAAIAADDAARAGVFWRSSTHETEDRDVAISLMGELDDALAADQIEVFYQPKYNLREDRITSVEALVRWQHPQRGFIGPDLFIPLAEKTNRIEPMTLHVLRRVVRDLAAWRSTHADVTAAVNISANLLSDASFNTRVEAILRASGLPNSSLVFEVTESATMSDPVSAIAALKRYRDLGIAVSMDDYGTGQSTLTYLRQLPLSELKIDRSFVQHAHRNANDALLVRSTIELAHNLGLKVVAEGVEDVDCLAFLRDCGCDLIQGYLISRPVPLPRLLQLLDASIAQVA
ncbi:EAL domain-containing protein [Sphingomonas sp. Leaf357]|uniref:EAL domain-containing protein n=1 Tax=Sphingomonas sp. Leaf357 TaxID=1736350 RepID=UPI001F3A5E3A|nr:EAL domain-containing protein [Sphingomonas sp. Leaf357]